MGFYHLANSGEKHCLTIDCSTKNRNGPGRYRTLADNPDQQVYYFNKPQDDIFYNVFISKRIKTENFDQGINFKIETVRGKTEKESFDAKKTLEDATSDDRLYKIFRVSKQPGQREGGKGHAESDEYFFRRGRKSARPQFLSRRCHFLSFLVQNFNLINLDRKLDNTNERLYVKILWDKCLPHAITRFIYLSEN